MEEFWSDPRNVWGVVGGTVGVLGVTWGVLSFHWNRRESRLEALSKVLQPMIRAAQQLHRANDLRRQCEILKRSFPETGAKEAHARIESMIEDYGKAISEGEDQFRLAQAENESRIFRFRDKIARLVYTAKSSLSEFGQHVNAGKFNEADLQFAKFGDDYAAVKRAGRGLRLAAPFEGVRKYLNRKPSTPKPGKFELSEKEMQGVMGLLHRRATTQAGNTFAVHPPQKLLDRPNVAKSDEVIDELEKSVFVVVYQGGTNKMLSLPELVVFLFLHIDLQM